MMYLTISEKTISDVKKIYIPCFLGVFILKKLSGFRFISWRKIVRILKKYKKEHGSFEVLREEDGNDLFILTM